MKQFGDLTELNSIALRKNTYAVNLTTSSGTYTATVNLALPPVLSGSDTLVAIAATQSLTNKTLDSTNTITARDDRFSIIDDADATKIAVFSCSTIGTGTTRTYTLPNASGELTILNATQTLSNKTIAVNSTTFLDTTASTKTFTLDTQEISPATNRNIRIPDLAGIIALTAGAQTITQKNLKSATNLLTGAAADSFVTETGSFVITLPAGANRTLVSLDGTETLTNKNLKSGTNLITGAKADSLQTETGNYTITLPAGAARTLASLDGTETLTNKILGSSKIPSTTEITDSSDATKQLAFSLSGMTTAKTVTIASSASDDRTITLPNESGTVTLNDAVQTLTNKDVVVDSTTFRDQADSSKTFHFVASSLSAASNRLITIPNFNGTMATLAGSESLTNKNLKSATNLLTGAAADSFVTETGGHVITLPAGAARTLASLTGTETLSSKTLVTPIISNYMDVVEDATPSTPSSGTVRVYAKNDKKLYKKDSNGTESEIGAGGASGINYVSNSDFETGATTGWATYADAAGTTPVDGTGGSPGVTISASSSSPLRGTYSLQFSKDAANRQGQGFSYDFTIASADVSRPLQITCELEASANYVASDMGVYVYDVTNATLITPSQVNIPAGKSKFIANFNATTSTSYRLIFHVQTSANVSAYTLKADTVSVGPSVLAVGPAVSDWVDYTPTLTAFGTPTGAKYAYRRVGDTLQVRAKFTAGTATATEARLTFPTGCTAASSHSDISIAGVFNRSSTSALSYYVLREAGLTYFTFARADGTNDGLTKLNGSALINTGETISFNAEVQIAEWSGSGNVVNGPNVEYASNSNTSDADSTSSVDFVNDPNGSFLPGNLTADRQKRFQFQYPIQPTDKLSIEILSDNANKQWVPLTATRGGSLAFLSLGGTNYGLLLIEISSTQMNLYISRYAKPSTSVTLGAAGQEWGTSGFNNYRWRVKKESGVAATALSEAVPGQSNGFLSFNGVKGKTDAVAVTAGYVGEIINGSVTSAGAAITSTVEKEFASITLTPGVWMVYGQIHATTTGTPGADGVIQASIGDVAGSGGNADYMQAVPQTRAAGGGIRLAAPPRMFNVSAATSLVKIWGYMAFTTSTHTVGSNSKLYAVRIA